MNEEKDFIIIKYPVEVRRTEQCNSNWCIIWAKPIEKPTNAYLYRVAWEKISHEDALSLIDAAGLERVLDNNFGEVYDTPDCRFQRKYKGKIEIRNSVGQ